MLASKAEREQEILRLRGLYSGLSTFEHEGCKVRVVAYVQWTKKSGIQEWRFKLSNKKIIKVQA